MFELSIAKKYLLPKRGQLSVSLIAIMSVVVISLVVWLVLVFLSVTSGIERSWLKKLTAFNGPIRITPTPDYFSSYYHQIDSFSAASNYSSKSLRDKAAALNPDPYDRENDMELPLHFPAPDLDSHGVLIDPVQCATQILRAHHLPYQEYEIGGAMLRLQMMHTVKGISGLPEVRHSFLTQASYVSSLSDRNPDLDELLIKPSGMQISSAAVSGGVWLPKQFQESGVQLGDRGFLIFAAYAASSVQEQRMPIVVAGFYDPGIMAVGNKCILAPPDIVHTLNVEGQSFHLDPGFSHGIQVWVPSLKDTLKIKRELGESFKEAGIDRYWTVHSYHDYDFAKDLLQQFQSDKYMFTLVGAIILIVACCNIITLLVLLVGDKKREIAILQAMGARTFSIALIFAVCGAAVGIISSLCGTIAALFTLHHIDSLAHLLSVLQGHDAFNALFYGKSLPNTLSTDALFFILVATPLISLVAGLVPALKACRLRPSAILRSDT